MAKQTVKTLRVQVILNEDLVERIDDYASAIGMSRSALCAYFIGQGLFGITKGLETATDAVNGIMRQMVESSDGLQGQIEMQDFLANMSKRV